MNNNSESSKRKRGERLVPARVPQCHPEQKYFKSGLCASCYSREHRAELAASLREWRAKNAEQKHAYHRQWVYNISPQEYEARFAEQNGRCAICNEPLTKPHIDHDHRCCSGDRSCGKCVRGLLCQDCNRGLGSFHDDPINLLNAIEYLLGINL